MTLIDGDRVITAQLYDDEHEEFIEKKMSIIDYVNTYTDEGVTTADDVLAKIRAEIADLNDADYDYEGYYKAVTDAVNIIDKYKAERSDPG